MQTAVNIHKLRRGIRYTFTRIDGSGFRANLDTYQSMNGIPRMAIRLTSVNGLRGMLCTPISSFRSVAIYALPNSIPYFPYLIPEVNMLINQHL